MFLCASATEQVLRAYRNFYTQRHLLCALKTIRIQRKESSLLFVVQELKQKRLKTWCLRE